MKNRFIAVVYTILFLLLAVSAITQYEEKGLSAIWMSLAVAVLYILPIAFERLFSLYIPPLLKYMILAFIFLCLHLGGILSFYERFHGWDSFIHLASGFVIPVIALSVINFLNRDHTSLTNLTPGFIFVFMILFAAGISLLWEYAEFLSDSVFGTNHLNDTVLNNGLIDIGLIDTMKDLLFSQSSSLLTSFCLYRAVKKQNHTVISRILITYRKH